MSSCGSASGYPHLEEAYTFAEEVLPLLPLNHATVPKETRANTGPFGEIVANHLPPEKRQAQS